MSSNPNHHKSKTSAANQRRRNLDEWSSRYKTANKGTNTKKETNMGSKSNTPKGANKQNTSPEVKEEVIEVVEEIQAPKDLPTEPKTSEEDLEEIKKIYGNGKSEDEVEAAAKAAEAAAEKLRSTAKAALDEAQAKTKDAAEEEEVVLEEKLKSTEDVLKEKYEDLGKEEPKDPESNIQPERNIQDVVDYFGSAVAGVAKQLHVTSMSKAISGWFKS